PPRRAGGGLAPWQQARATEYMEAHLESRIGLLELAALCQLSPSRFGRAFKASTGVTPHRWLVARRLARARQLMLGSDATLAAIAQQCGFSDQSHLAREFRRAEGVGPAEFRRLHPGRGGRRFAP
ncbi:MAG: AraC family transcriptional regulator, partial [Duganella sp.]